MSLNVHSKFATPLAFAAAISVAAVGCKGESGSGEAEDTSTAPSAGTAEADNEPAGGDEEAGDDKTAEAETESESSGESSAKAEPGAPAPSFTLTGADGETYSLEDYEGQWVILEWINHGCPYVQKFYGSGTMQKLQEKYTGLEEADVAWFSVASSAPGKQGHETPERWNEITEDKGGNATAVLLDEDGTVGQKYGARTTPHMYVIDPDGTLVYHGAMDDQPSTDPETLEGAENYVEAALTAGLEGEDPPYEYRDPYGCSVKYGSS